MPRRRITTTVSDSDDQPSPQKPNSPLGTKLLLLALIVFALYGMKECYDRYPPRWTRPQVQH